MDIGIIAASIAVLTGAGAGVSIGIATGRQANHCSSAGSGWIIRSALLLGCALAEGTAIFGFITALLIVFAQ